MITLKIYVVMLNTAYAGSELVGLRCTQRAARRLALRHHLDSRQKKKKTTLTWHYNHQSRVSIAPATLVPGVAYEIHSKTASSTPMRSGRGSFRSHV